MAVMQSRRSPLDELDDFPTPPWAARALCEYVIKPERAWDSLWEPSANRGYMIKGLSSYFRETFGSDIHEYEAGYEVIDFLNCQFTTHYDWIITNPPFKAGEAFALRGIQWSKKGTAILVRSAFLEGSGRYNRLFNLYPPSIVAQFTERVPMVKGRIDGKASTATAYCWVVWEHKFIKKQTEFMWIPPCRKRLEREGDYK